MTENENRHGCTYTYYRATCENHPAPARRPLIEVNHTQQLLTVTDASDEFIDKITTTMTPDECDACGGELDIGVASGEWPLEDPTSEDILNLFRDTEGALVLEVYPDDRDRRFFIGEIGGRYEVLDEQYRQGPQFDPASGVDDLPELAREHPTTLTPVDGTPLEGAYESWQNFEGRFPADTEGADVAE